MMYGHMWQFDLNEICCEYIYILRKLWFKHAIIILLKTLALIVGAYARINNLSNTVGKFKYELNSKCYQLDLMEKKKSENQFMYLWTCADRSF